MQFNRNDQQTINQANSRPLKSNLGFIPEGRAGTLATLKIMARLARAAKTSLVIRSLAVELTNGCAQKDWLCEIKALHAFVRDKIRYVKDVRDVETLTTPETLLAIGAGDCDDKSVLLAALLESINHPTRFVAIAFAPDDFVHVFAETRVGNNWIALETTEPVEIGWTPPGVADRVVVHT
jgi:transglutaminase-like putative cysteine protease